MIITAKQKLDIERLFPDSHTRLLEGNDLFAILDALDDLYLDLLDEDQEPTPESDECEELRDAIHFQNMHT